MKPSTIPELQEMVRSQPRLRLRGGGSKTALAGAAGDAATLETGELSGMRQYQPEEFTFTALAGTPLAQIEAELAEHGQYLPFDPPLVEAGATLGGTVAAGLSGPCRVRYGGVRDFVLGVRFVDGQGNLVRSGGKVVKNAAGFDLAKFMTGAVGEFGALVELSFKVFPRPLAFTTLRSQYASLEQALPALARVANSPLELFAVDLEPLDGGYALHVRLGNPAPEIQAARMGRLQGLLCEEAQPLEPQVEAELWRVRREFSWLGSEQILIKVPLTPGSIPALERFFQQHDVSAAQRIYSAAGNVAWIGWAGEAAVLDAALEQLALSGLALIGPAQRVWFGLRRGEVFAQRVRQALDPQGKFYWSAGG
jgi:glycolate oxidase FAD binding subunit